MLDIQLKNGKYNWSKKIVGVGHIVERLDRIIVSIVFLQQYLLPASFTLPSAISDQKLINLTLTSPANLGPIPFCFNSIWLQDGKIIDIIKNTWNLQGQGSPSYIWEPKLRCVYFVIKNWVKNDHKNPSH